MNKRTVLKKQFFAASRWLHIYIAMTFLTLLLFFCITGITLNHAAWFESKSDKHTYQFNLPTDLLLKLNKNETPDVKTAQLYIEGRTNLEKPRTIDLDIEAREISFDYPLPAGYAFVIVNLASGEVEIERNKGSLLTLLNDLHKGRHSGMAWSWVIDISAIAIAVFSATGLVILFQHNKKRNSGLVLAVMGLILPIIVYFIWVPNFAFN